jgi:hypothetical protein
VWRRSQYFTIFVKKTAAKKYGKTAQFRGVCEVTNNTSIKIARGVTKNILTITGV